MGKRLPTEAEWEKAARGGLKNQMYPWGNAAIRSSRASYASSKTSPVGKFPANGYGLFDMSGNVYEWCLDVYLSEFYAYSPEQNPIAGGKGVYEAMNTTTHQNSYRVFRGGSYLSTPVNLRVSYRRTAASKSTSPMVGFRCVKEQTR